jgi:hypothetical protein
MCVYIRSPHYKFCFLAEGEQEVVWLQEAGYGHLASKFVGQYNPYSLSTISDTSLLPACRGKGD